MTTRLIIYLLAMLTGFSAAEAARPVSAVPASVGAEIGQAYASVTVMAVEQTQDRPPAGAQISVSAPAARPGLPAFSVIAATTPVIRHDVILG